MSVHEWRRESGWGLARALSAHQMPMSPGLISVNDGAAADCGREIQNNILVHIRIAPPTSSPRLLGIIWIMVDKFKGCPYENPTS